MSVLRILITTVVVAAVLGCGAVYAQDDDGWGEIVGLMNGLTHANQQFLNQGGLSMPAGPGMGGLTPGFAEGLADWARAYAQVLNSVDGAFDVDGAGCGPRGLADPFNPNTPNPLWEQFNRWQSKVPYQGVGGYQVPQSYQSYQNYPNRQLYVGYQGGTIRPQQVDGRLHSTRAGSSSTSRSGRP